MGEGIEFEIEEGDREKLEGFHGLLLGARWLKKSVKASFSVLGKEENSMEGVEGEEKKEEQKEKKGGKGEENKEGSHAVLREAHHCRGPLWYLVIPLIPPTLWTPSSSPKPMIDWEMITLLLSLSPSYSSPSKSPDPIQLDQLVRKIYSPNSPSPSPSSSPSSPSSSHLVPDESFLFPQIWRPKYNPMKRYIVYGPSNLTTLSPFPKTPSPFGDSESSERLCDSPSRPCSLDPDAPSYATFKEYFSVRYKMDSGDVGLYKARPIWDFSGSMSSYLPNAASTPHSCSVCCPSSPTSPTSSLPSPPPPPHECSCSPSINLEPPPSPSDSTIVQLPSTVCYVDPLPFAYLFFGALFLPQTLYYLEHVYQTRLFVNFSRFLRFLFLVFLS